MSLKRHLELDALVKYVIEVVTVDLCAQQRVSVH